MANWTDAGGFDWDAGNVRKSAYKHNVSCAEAEQIFFNEPLLVLDDVVHSRSEPRFHALGLTDEQRKLHVTFTIRVRKTAKLIRIISARDMHRKERLRYEQTKTDSRVQD